MDATILPPPPCAIVNTPFGGCRRARWPAPAQAEARADGVPAHLVAHRTFPGNRSSSTILADRLTPATLGALVALYEHSVFTQAAVWDVNAFDQWGVELGKKLAGHIAPELAADMEPALGHDSSTNALIRRYRARRAAGGGVA